MPRDPLAAIMAGQQWDPVAALLGRVPRDPLEELLNPAGPGRAPGYAPAYDSQEEADSVMMRLLSPVMGGLQYVGETLDKPGRAARGLLAGQPSELLNLLPFSDTLGITDPSKSVSGRDLLEKAGVLSQNTPGLDWGDVAGLGAELVTDPLSYLGLGAVGAATKSGQAALKAGTAAKSVAGGIRAGERGLAKLGIPGFPTTQTVLGTGERAAQFAEQTIDPLLDKVRYGNPVGRTLGALFNKDAGEMLTGSAQKDLAEALPAWRKADYEARIPLEQMKTSLMEPDAARGWHLDDVHKKAMRAGAEFATDPSNASTLLEELSGGDPQRLGTLNQAAAMGRSLHELTKGMVSEANAVGVHAHELIDPIIDYLPRSHAPSEWPGLIGQLRDTFRTREKDLSRLDFLKGFEGGTNQINDLVRDPQVLTGKPLQAAKYVAGFLPAAGEEAERQAGKFVQWARFEASKAVPDVGSVLDQALAAGADTSEITKAIPDFFNGDPISDTIVRQGRHVRQMSRAEFNHGLIKKNAVQYATPEAAAAEGFVPVLDALEKGGIDFHKVNFNGKGIPPDIIGGQATAAKNLGLPLDLEAVRFSTPAGIRTEHQVKGLANYYVPADIAADMKRLDQVWKAPDALQPVLDGYDNALNIWKQMSTQMWPGFHARNLISGLYYQLVSGNHYGGATGITGTLQDASKLLFGGELDPARLAALGVQNSDELLTQLRATGVLKNMGTQAGELVGGAADAAAQLPWTGQQAGGIKGWLAQLGGGVKDSLGQAMPAGVTDLRGMAKAPIDVAGTMMNAGRQVGNKTEDLMRVAHYLGAKARGFSDLEAAAQVKKWLFDYSELTQFEKQAMKRVFPFYSFARKNLPLTLTQLMEHPGGALAQSIRASNAPRKDGGFVPQNVSEGLAIPFPGNPDRFVTGLGLPFEAAFDPFAKGSTTANTVQRNIEGVVSQSSPVLKLGYSLASQREPFSGRPLDELYPFPTSDITTNAVANSILGTPLTRVRTAIDERKGLGSKALNLLTGARVTDVSGGIDAARDRAVRKINEQQLRENPLVQEFTDFSVPAQFRGSIPPELLANLRLQATQRAAAKKRAKEKAQTVGAGRV